MSDIDSILDLPKLSKEAADFARRLAQSGRERLSAHGDAQQRSLHLAALPALGPLELVGEAPGSALPLEGGAIAQLKEHLLALGPWKKGPFRLGDLTIDAEWRSDLKWHRLSQVMSSPQGKRVLDVGTGNGYYLMRFALSGAELALGLEPGFLPVTQWRALARLFELPRGITLLPAFDHELDQAPADFSFDIVLSLGVLYHRQDPLAHLRSLSRSVAEGGELILETLVIDGAPGDVLRPTGRYAQMRNVHQIPSVATLIDWIRATGFSKVTCGPVVPTLPAEQRRTEWAEGPSLADFVRFDPQTALPVATIEGHPPPRRVIVRATRT